MKMMKASLSICTLLLMFMCELPHNTVDLNACNTSVSVNVVGKALTGSYYMVTVTGDGMKTIGPERYDGGSTIRLNVPPGDAREFRFLRYASDDVLSDTCRVVTDIKSGKNTVNVSLTRVIVEKRAFSVSYDGNQSTSGKVPDVQTKTEGIALQLADNSGNLQRTGYSFVGWNTSANGKGTDYAEGASSDNSGSLERTGFKFVGWNTSSDGKGTDYAEGASYTKDSAVTLYAKWTKLLTYAVSYNDNQSTSGKIPDAQTKIEGIALQLATNNDSLKRTGFKFVGWNTSSDGKGTDYAEGASYTKDSAVTLYAKWTALDVYTIRYEGNQSTGGEAPAIQTQEKGKPLTIEPNSKSLERTGYMFDGWSTSADGIGTEYKPGDSYNGNVDLVLYAKWIKVFFVRYDGNQNSSGSAPATQIKIIDKPLTLETNSGSLERTGFTFAGWSTSADGIGTEYPPGGTYIINSDVVLYAKWEPVP